MQVEQTATPVVTDSAAPSVADVAAPVPSQVAPQAAPQAQPIPESSAEPVPSVEPVREPTLLEKFDADQAAKETPKGEEKPAPEAAKDETKADDKPVEAGKEETKEPEVKAPEPHVWEELTLPEGFTKRLDIPEAEVNKRVGELNDVLLKDINPNAKRSELLALHVQALQEYQAKVQKDQANAWNEYNKTKVLETMADAELGGSGHQTAMGAVARVRDEITRGWSKTNKQQLNEFLIATGAGSHPAFLRLMHSAAKFIDEPQIPSMTPSPTKENGLRETGKGGRKSVLYDNPRST